MPDVKQVTAIISNPTKEDVKGRVTIGYITVSDGVLTMMDGDGKPIRRRHSGEVCKQKVAEGDDLEVIAKRLTLSIWRSNTGGDTSGGFNRRLIYPDIGVCRWTADRRLGASGAGGLGRDPATKAHLLVFGRTSGQRKANQAKRKFAHVLSPPAPSRIQAQLGREGNSYSPKRTGDQLCHEAHLQPRLSYRLAAVHRRRRCEQMRRERP